MSMNSGLSRDPKNPLILLKGGKPYVIGLDTGDDTEVKVDERQDVDINRLVANQAAREMAMPVPVYQDLTDRPESLGEAEHRMLELSESLRSLLRPGDTLASALARLEGMREELRSRAAARAFVTPPPSPEPPKDAKSVPGPDSGPSKA